MVMIAARCITARLTVLSPMLLGT